MFEESKTQESPLTGLPNEKQLEREIRAIAERTMIMKSQGFVTHLIVNRSQPVGCSR